MDCIELDEKVGTVVRGIDSALRPGYLVARRVDFTLGNEPMGAIVDRYQDAA